MLDGYAVVGGSQLGSWDYLGGMLVCTEAGAVVGEPQDRDLVTLTTPIAGAGGGRDARLCCEALVDAERRSSVDAHRAFSSVGQSSWLTTSRSSVRVRQRPLPGTRQEGASH